MVAATLVLLCTKPVDIALFVDVPWLLTVPSIAIIGREVGTCLFFSISSSVVFFSTYHELISAFIFLFLDNNVSS